MKKLLTTFFIFIFCGFLFAQQGIKYTVDTAEFYVVIDSVNKATYKKLGETFEKAMSDKDIKINVSNILPEDNLVIKYSNNEIKIIKLEYK